MNGALSLPAFNGQHYELFGGPYARRPHHTIGVRLAAEIQAPAEIVIPTKDYCTPKYDDLINGLDKSLDYLIGGHTLYVGCMGGMGRTGLFMAALVKLWGINHPVEYVREMYYSHAVETEEQYNYVKNLKFPFRLRMKVVVAKMRGWLHKPNIVPDNVMDDYMRVLTNRIAKGRRV